MRSVRCSRRVRRKGRRRGSARTRVFPRRANPPVDSPHRVMRRIAKRPIACLHAAGAHSGDYLECVAAVEETAAELKTPWSSKDIPRPRPSFACSQSDARSRRHRSQPSAGRIVGRNGPANRRPLRGGAANAFDRREIHAGRTPYWHWRRQSFGAGRPDAFGSPLLRRPDLLRSLLGYWQNHPSLSFLFSGLFIAPPAKVRAWMKRATILFTSWKQSSSKCPPRKPSLPG